MPPPPNTTAATATVLTMNSVVSLDVSGAAAPLHEVWYAYTATSADVLVGFWAAADPAGTYDVATEFLQGSPSSLDAAFGFGAIVQKPVQVQMTAETTYYFRIYNLGSTEPITDLLHVSLTRAANTAVPAGSLAINDDAPGWPLVLLSPTTGEVLQTRPFPAGETGTVLPNGLSVWHDSDVAVFRLYDATLSLVTTPAWTFDGVSPPITSNRVDTFYLGDPGATFPSTHMARVTTMDSSGALGATVWTLPEVGLRVIAVSLDETVLYHHGQATGGSSIQRWDLVANTALSPLAATVSGYQPLKDLLVMADGTIVSGYVTPSGPYDSFLRVFSPSGTVLHTYSLGSVRLNRITWALDDPDSIWTWSFLTGASDGTSRFTNVLLSDGSTITTFDNVRYEGGVWVPATVPPPPPTVPDFGHSPSCPLMVFPASLPPYLTPGGGGGGGPEVLPPYVAPSYDLEERIIRRLRRTPHVNNDNKRVFYRTFELDLERGVGLATGQGSDPLVMLRLSRDGGHTWGEPMTMSAGQLGVYTQRVIARRLGQARDCVFEVTVSDPVAWSLVNAWLELEAGTH